MIDSKKPRYTLTDWAVEASPYVAPEACDVHLSGKRDGGKRVLTSPIIAANGRTVETRNSFYELGEPHPEYVYFLRRMGRKIDPVQPVKVHAR